MKPLSGDQGEHVTADCDLRLLPAVATARRQKCLLPFLQGEVFESTCPVWSALAFQSGSCIKKMPAALNQHYLFSLLPSISPQSVSDTNC